MSTEQTITRPHVRKEPGEKTEAVKRKSLGGLCTTCRHAQTCTYPVHTLTPVIHCEDFEVVRTISTHLRGEREKSKGTETQDDSHDESFLGLCTNCRNRHSCIYAKTEGGVWHCEEYK
jgi:hypothetical protein